MNRIQNVKAVLRSSNRYSIRSVVFSRDATISSSRNEKMTIGYNINNRRFFNTRNSLSTSQTASTEDTASEGGKKVYEVFDRNAKRMQRDRAASYTETSRLTDYLKDEVALRVADRLLDIKKRYDTVLEIGAGCGHLVKALDEDITDKLIMCEFSEKMLHRDDGNEHEVKIEKRVMNEEVLDLEPSSYDVIVSNLSMHWVNDLPGMLIQVNKALKPDGVFIGALFGGDTLFELRTSLQLADVERSGGIAPRVSPMIDSRDMGGLLNRAGFVIPTVDVEDIVVNYPSMVELMCDLNSMGEGNALYMRSGNLRRDVIIAASSIYKELYANKDGTVPATFHVVYLIGWKPDPSQPKPLERGSGEISLKTLLEK